MYKRFFQHYMTVDPSDTDHKYIFIVDDPALAENILLSQYQVVCIRERDEQYFSEVEFYDYLDSIAFRGTSRSEYVYVPACGSRRRNEQLEAYLKGEGLQFRTGWKLFWDKPYLAKIDAQPQLKELLHHFIWSYENPSPLDPDLARFHEVDSDGNPGKVLDLNVVDYLLETVPFFVLGGAAFVYENGVYMQDDNGIRLKSRIQKLIHRSKVTQPTINRIYQLLKAQEQVQRTIEDLYNYPQHWVNFKNGFYDPIEGTMVDHDPKYYAINQIPFRYEPETDIVTTGGEHIRSYLSYSIPDPIEQNMLWEYLGYCMTVDNQFQKFLMFLGEGGTGKSVAIDLFQNVLGKVNCAHVSLQDLNKRFYATNLFGKLLNACGDIPCKAMDTVDVVKKATGEDMLLLEHKGQDPLYFQNHAKLLFSANAMPENVEEKSDAFFRRILILDINRKIPIEKKDTQLKKKMALETDYAIHMAMQGLTRLYRNGAFSESMHSRECVQEIQHSSDSVKAFTDTCLERKQGTRTERTVMYLMYEDYCRASGRIPLGKKRFFIIMERKGYGLRKSKGTYYYVDVQLKAERAERADYENTEDDAELR